MKFLRLIFMCVMGLLILPCVGSAQANHDNGPYTVKDLKDLPRKSNRLDRELIAKIGEGLSVLFEDFSVSKEKAGVKASRQQFTEGDSLFKIIDDRVVIDAVASGNVSALRFDLEALGMQKTVTYGAVVSGQLPVAAIDDMAALESLQFARPVYAITNVGLVDSQGDVAMRSDIVRAAEGVDGTGVIIGTLSDSFNCLGGAATDVASGDLPAGISVLDDSICFGSIDEGRAMMQLIADVAPGADQAFHTAFGGMADFAQGIVDLADAGANIIVDDVLYFYEPMFQDGIVAQAVNTVVSRGVAYFSSAGNTGSLSYESDFNPSGISIALDGSLAGEAHDFDPGLEVDILQNISVGKFPGLFILVFQWDSLFFSVNPVNEGSSNDLNIFLVDSTGTTVLAKSTDINIGRDPAEVLYFDSTSGCEDCNLLITHAAGPNPGLMKYVIIQPFTETIFEFDTASGTLYGHANATGAEAVGAAFYQNTPEFGVDPPRLAGGSAHGSTPILFDTNGQRLAAPEVRKKPNIVAPDGTNNTFFGGDADRDGFPNFFGTSAAAPHAAAVAALVRQTYPAASPDFIYTILKNTAINMLEPGFDFASGFGLIDTVSAFQWYTRPPVNEFVRFDPDKPSYKTTYDITDCPAGFAGKFSFDAKLANQSERVLSDLLVEIVELSDGNMLLANTGLIAENESFPVTRRGDYDDGELSPGESVDVSFTVCLNEWKPFRFFVNVAGTVGPLPYYLYEEISFDWIDATAGTSYPFGDDDIMTLPIGFNFEYYGDFHSNVTISANGLLAFDTDVPVRSVINSFLPNPDVPNDLIAPLWDDLNPDEGGAIYTVLEGAAPNRRFTIAWVDVPHWRDIGSATFEVTLYEATGDIVFQYLDVDFGDTRLDFGASATVGVEGPNGENAIQYSFNEPILQNEFAIRFYQGRQ